MKKFPPLPVTDLLVWATKNEKSSIYGRTRSIRHMARLIGRKSHNNMVIVGKRGVGKTRLLFGFSQAVLNEFSSSMPALPYLFLHTSTLVSSMKQSSNTAASIDHIAHAFNRLPASVFIIDDAEQLMDHVSEVADFDRLFELFIHSKKHRLILVFEEEGWKSIEETYGRSFKTFDVLHLQELKPATVSKIVKTRAKTIARSHNLQITSLALEAIVAAASRLPSSRSEPDKSLRLLDEVCALTAVTKKTVVTPQEVQQLMNERLGLPIHQQERTRVQKAEALHANVSKKLLGQDEVVDRVTSIVKRGLLGLKNPNRPLGSFLFLGPSGVGKTELAKVLAKEVYGNERAFVRIDMSEFSDAHTVQRLLGAPPGYVGYEAGGQLTNPIMQQPFSLILLDEIEKAHPTVFDIFLQVLDDGRLTDGKGQTVDFRNTLLIATSNIGIKDIVSAWKQNVDVTSPEFLRQTMMPLLSRLFRLEFLNRFEAISVFTPFNTDTLLSIAKLEIQKIEERFAQYHVAIHIAEEELREHIAVLSDPHLGARPLKRFIEEKCETAIAQAITSKALSL